MKAVIKNEVLHEKWENKIRRESFLSHETYVNINNNLLIICLINSSIRNVHDKMSLVSPMNVILQQVLLPIHFCHLFQIITEILIHACG